MKLGLTNACGFAVALLAGGIVGTAANAACPTIDSIPFGIFISYDDESYSRVTRVDDRSTFEDINYMDGSGYRVANILQDGVIATLFFEFEDAQVKPVSVVQTTFSGGTLDIDAMAPGSEVLLNLERVDRTGTSRGTVLISKGEATSETFGSCEYQVHSVSLEETIDRTTRTTVLFYFPELGVSALRRIVEPDGRFADFLIEKISDDFPWVGRD